MKFREDHVLIANGALNNIFYISSEFFENSDAILPDDLGLLAVIVL